MHKDGKWARQIISQQQPDGRWGWFHSLAKISDAPLTTEQALGRLERLGFTIEDDCIQKAVAYMDDCLTGRNSIPDRAEKVHDWGIFTSLILSARIRRFTPDNPNANAVAQKWAQVVTRAFASGEYDREQYVAAYHEVLGMKPGGGRIIDFMNFYPVSLLCDCLDERTQCAFMDYALEYEGGIYYIYDHRISRLPEEFASRRASGYLAAIELLVRYEHAKRKLGFVRDWLYDNRNENGRWDMGPSVRDKVYFPLSDDWRKRETRENDCTERIEKLLSELG